MISTWKRGKYPNPSITEIVKHTIIQYFGLNCIQNHPIREVEVWFHMEI